MPDDIKACFKQLPNPSSEEVRECFPETGKAGNIRETEGITAGNSIFGIGDLGKRNPKISGDNGGNASRFFKSIIYQAKASKSERNKGCEELYILKDNTPKDDIDEIKHLLSI